MKNTLLILMSLLLLGSCGEKLTSPDPASLISVVVDYNEKPYNYGEPVSVDLAIKELLAEADYYYLTARCEGGTADLVVDDETVAWNEVQTLYYDKLNEHFASKALRCVITPDASASLLQTLTVEFLISNASLEQTAVQHIKIKVNNTHPIVVSVESDPLPLDIGIPLDIELTVTKEGFVGDIEVLPTLESGAGYFVYSGENIEAGKPFKLSCPSKSLLQYQPTAKGTQDIVLTLSDGVQTTKVEVHSEVYNNGGLERPTNGIYIYSEGLYYSRIRWLYNRPTTKAEGVAVVADQCRFLLAKTDISSDWGGGDISKIEGFPNYETEAQARSDYDGLQNTRKILEALYAGLLTNATAAYYCYHYDKEHPGLWYLPSSGQIALIVDNYREIYMSLREVDYYSVFKNGEGYVSSSGYKREVWGFWSRWDITKAVFEHQYQGHGSYARPVRTLK